LTRAKFRIRIEEPCSVAKDRLTKVDLGYHCSVCDKCIVDFSHYSDQQIAREFNRETNKERCGIFTHAQLEKVYQEKTVKKFGFLSPLILSWFLMVNKNSHAQTNSTMDTILTTKIDSSEQMQLDEDIGRAEVDSARIQQESVTTKDTTWLPYPEVDWTSFGETHTLGFVVMESSECLPTPFENSMDSTRLMLPGFPGWFTSAKTTTSNPTLPVTPNNQKRNNDHPSWIESLLHKFRRKKRR
jgi:hypothetical protein